jgi:sulfopyruvate decarboxylase subunit alpha
MAEKYPRTHPVRAIEIVLFYSTCSDAPPVATIHSMFSSDQIVSLLRRLSVTHVVTVPDSTIGQWESAITRAGIRLVRVCREGEAWAVAGGLYLGGAKPLVMIQCTGLFESGDALRNVLHDWKLPIPSVIGYRSYFNQETLPGDTCLVFTEPILRAWNIDYRLVTEPDLDGVVGHLMACSAEGRSGTVLLGEGRA